MRPRIQKTLNVLANIALLGAVVGFAFGPQGPFGEYLRDYRNASAVARAIKANWQELMEGPRLGPLEATVTLIEFTDYECPYCRQEHDRMSERLKRLDGVALIVHHFPLPIHFAAAGAARSAICAGDQGYFAGMHEQLNTESEWLVDTNWVRLAQEIKLPDVSQFEACIGSAATIERLERQKTLGASLGVTGTPTFFVAGKKHYGIMSDSVFAALIWEAGGADTGSASRDRSAVR